MALAFQQENPKVQQLLMQHLAEISAREAKGDRAGAMSLLLMLRDQGGLNQRSKDAITRWIQEQP